MANQVQQINYNHSSVKLSKIGLLVSYKKFSDIASFVKKDSSKIVFPLNKFDVLREFNCKEVNNDSHLLLKLKMC